MNNYSLKTMEQGLYLHSGSLNFAAILGIILATVILDLNPTFVY